jgi:hypothetical protein
MFFAVVVLSCPPWAWSFTAGDRHSDHTMGDFKVCVSVGVYCTKCTLNTGVNTNFEITQCMFLQSQNPNDMVLSFY